MNRQPTDPHPGSPRDPRATRFDGLTAGLRVLVAIAVALAIGAIVLPGDVGHAFGTALVALLVAGPMARTGWFVGRWTARGDPRFALVGAGVVVVVLIGALLA